MNIIYIGISGNLGSGKNYIMENIIFPELQQILKQKTESNSIIYPMEILFGDQMKVELYSRTNIIYDDLFDYKTDETRKLLQQYGTENGRNKYGNNIWIYSVQCWIEIQKNRLIKLYKNQTIFLVVLIADVRFINEYNYILDNNGLLIRVEASDRNQLRLNIESDNDKQIKQQIQNHESETQLNDYHFDFIINNSIDQKPESLRKQVQLILQQFCDNTL